MRVLLLRFAYTAGAMSVKRLGTSRGTAALEAAVAVAAAAVVPGPAAEGEAS